jgi:hypothetical protein
MTEHRTGFKRDEGSRGAWVEIGFDQYRYQTSMAYLVEIGGKEFWFPKSQTRNFFADGSCEIQEWLAREKGLI